MPGTRLRDERHHKRVSQMVRKVWQTRRWYVPFDVMDAMLEEEVPIVGEAELDEVRE